MDTLYIINGKSQTIIDSIYISVVNSTGNVDTTFLLKTHFLIKGQEVQTINWYNSNTMSIMLTVVFGIITVFSIYYSKKYAKISEKNLNNIEDATRKCLNGFPEIFAKAIWFLDNAVGEIYYSNFLLGFGEPHKVNHKITNEYKNLAGKLRLEDINEYNIGNASTFDGAVKVFQNKMLEKIKKEFNHVKILLPSKDFLEFELFPKFKQMKGYKELKSETFMATERTLFEKLEQSISERKDYNLEVEAVTIEKCNDLPFQLMIAQINTKKGAEAKWACLVFLIGNANIGKGKPSGYYSELEHIVDLHKDLFESLIPRKAKLNTDIIKEFKSELN